MPSPGTSPRKSFGLHVLGGCALTGPEGLVGGRVAQRRRLACLAVIAAGGARGVARERIVGLLWPDIEDERARRLLSDTLYVLRAALGEEAIAAVGDRLVLGGDVVACDLWAFDEAMRERRMEEAVAAYGGPFLDAFHVPGAPDFAQWADGERDRHERAYVAALQTLALEADGRGDRAAAASWWRRLAALRPYEAPVARGLVLALDAAGDRAGALDHLRVHAALVREQLGAAPDDGLLALADRLRSAPAAPPPQPPPLAVSAPAPAAGPPPGAALARTPAPDAGATSARPDVPTSGSGAAPTVQANAAAPTSDGPTPDRRHAPAPGRQRRSRRLAWGAAALAMGALVAAAVRWSVGQRPPDPQPDRVAVLPFTVHGDSALHYVGDAMAELLAAGLDGAGDLRTVNPRSVLNVVRGGTRAPEHVDRATAERTATRLGAARFVLGDVTEAGGRLRIRAELYHRGRIDPVATTTVDGAPGEVLALSDQLATQLLAGAFDTPGTQLARAAALSTRSLGALRAYLDGERALRAVEDFSAGDRAIAAFQRAVQLDSTFALAHYRMSVAAQYWGHRGLARSASARAVRYRDRLGPRDQRLLAAWDAARRGDIGAAERQYGDVLVRYRADPEASYQLGDLLRQTGPLRGRSRVEALAPLRRALAIDARNGCARCSLLWLELSVGEPTVADTLVRGFDPRQHFMERVIGTGAVARSGGAAGWEPTLRRLAGVDDFELAMSAGWAGAGGADVRFLERAFGLMAAPGRSPDSRALGMLWAAQLALLQGRLGEAEGALRRVESIDPGVGRAGRALQAAYPFAAPPSGELIALAAALAADTTTRIDPPMLLGPDTALAPWVRRHLRGLVALRLGGRAPSVATVGSALPASGEPADPEVRAMADLLAADVAARRSLAAGRESEAIAEFERLGDRVPFQPSDLSPFVALTHVRFLRAELLLRAGRAREALAWYGTIGEIPIWDWAYVAPAELRQGEIRERLGDRARAAAHYRRVVALWQGADPALQPLVGQARRALDRMEGEGRR